MTDERKVASFEASVGPNGGPGARVCLNGKDITHSVLSFRVDAGVGRRTVVQLEFTPERVDVNGSVE